MSGNQSKPTLLTVLEMLKDDIFSSLNCHAIGTIKEFNPTTQRAYIEIAYSRKVENNSSTQERTEYPAMVDVPVISLRGGKGSLRFPISEGDKCILLFNDRDIDNFLESDSFNQLASDRKHSFSDAIALVGLSTKAGLLEDYDPDRTELVHDNTKISLKEKVKIENAARNLKTVLDSVMDILTTLSNGIGVTPGNQIYPGLAAQVATIKSQLGELLE